MFDPTTNTSYLSRFLLIGFREKLSPANPREVRLVNYTVLILIIRYLNYKVLIN
jgi:hypothetical protein